MSTFRFLLPNAAFVVVLIAFSSNAAHAQAQTIVVAPPATLKCKATKVPMQVVKPNGKTAWKCVKPNTAAQGGLASTPPAATPLDATAAANTATAAPSPPAGQPTPTSAPTPAVTSLPPSAASNVVQATVAPAKTAAALQADELIAKNVLARGGRDKLAAINTVRMRGTERSGVGMVGEVLIEIERPGNIRLELTLQGMTAVQTYDGKTGWSLSPFLGQTEPQPITGADLEALKARADFEGALINYEAKGSKVEFVADEEVEGAPAHKLKVMRNNGDILFVYLDVDGLLEIKTSADAVVGGQKVTLDTIVGDYKSSGGVLFARSLGQTLKGQPGAGTAFTIESIEVNPALSASRFSKP